MNDIINTEHLVDTRRHSRFFTRDRFHNKGVTVIGAGALGSIMALSIAKLGITNIDIYDDDTVESHNIANQMFGPEHMGMTKVDALADVIFRQTGTRVRTFNERVLSGHGSRMNEVVLVMVDRMDGAGGRKDIASRVLMGSPKVELIVEARLGVEVGSVFAIPARNFQMFQRWNSTFCTDEEVAANPEHDPDGCNTQQTIGATVRMVSAAAEWNILNHINGAKFDNEVHLCVRPMMIEGFSYA